MTRYFDLRSPAFRAAAVFAAISCAALIAYLSLTPSSDLPDSKMSDKLNHFIAYSVLSVPIIFALGRRRWLAALGIAIVYGGLMELAQGTLTASRSADFADAFANSLGAMLGVGIGYTILTLRR